MLCTLSIFILLTSLLSFAQKSKAKVALAETPSVDLNAYFKPLVWRNIGPTRGGRSVTAAGVKGNPLVYYMGTTGGGVWKTEDAGQNWKNISDGFFKTGDIGLMNQDGYVKIIDRKKDMVLVSGFNVYPSEVEEVIAMLPGVLECGVVGVPDEVTGEAVKAFIVKKDPNLSYEDVIAHCKTQLTSYKRPKLVEFRDELPKTNVGKILRRELRAQT